jgi:hypothetical protein
MPKTLVSIGLASSIAFISIVFAPMAAMAFGSPAPAPSGPTAQQQADHSDREAEARFNHQLHTGNPSGPMGGLPAPQKSSVKPSTPKPVPTPSGPTTQQQAGHIDREAEARFNHQLHTGNPSGPMAGLPAPAKKSPKPPK